MPVFTFKCDICGRVFEKSYQLRDDWTDVTCPDGHAVTHRQFSVPTIIFKGSGFYVNDSLSKRPQVRRDRH